MRDAGQGPGAAWRALRSWARYDAAYCAMRAVVVEDPTSAALPALRREYRLAERALMREHRELRRDGKP